MKYATAFPSRRFAGTPAGRAPTDQTRRLVVLTACVQSSATFAWDLCMDWGLFKRRRRGVYSVGNLRGRPDEGPASRLVFSKRSDMFIYAAYAGLVLFNFSRRLPGLWPYVTSFRVEGRHGECCRLKLRSWLGGRSGDCFSTDWEYHERGWPPDADSDNEETARRSWRRRDDAAASSATSTGTSGKFESIPRRSRGDGANADGCALLVSYRPLAHSGLDVFSAITSGFTL